MWFELDPEKGGSGIIKDLKDLIGQIWRRGISFGFSGLVLIVAVFLYGSASFSDTLETTTGEVLEGSVWEYDDFSYIVILENGGKAVVSRLHVNKVDWEKRGKERYKREKKLIVSRDWLKPDDGSDRIYIVRLKNLDVGQEPFTFRQEARVLHDLVVSERKYASAYVVSYSFGTERYELEYNWVKDMLIRRIFTPGLGLKTRYLGPRGKGREALDLAARGKLTEQDTSIFNRIQKPANVPHEGQVVVEPRKKVESQPIRKNWYDR